MSTTFDEKFEVWLNQQLQTIKLLTGFRANRHHLRQQLQFSGTESYHSTASYDTPPAVARQPIAHAEMARSNRDVAKHGGNYYQFAYDDDDDVQSFEDLDDNDDDDDRRRRQRLSRILGSECPDFGSETGFEMDDEMAAASTVLSQPLDENRNLFDAGKAGDVRANQYSTTSLEFSDAESFCSATGSDALDEAAQPSRGQVDWPDGGDGYTGDGLQGFIEFSRVRGENRRRSNDSDEDDPLEFRASQPPSGVQPKLLPSGLIAAISGRSRSNKKSPLDDSKSAKSPAGRRLDDMVAVTYHKTETATSGGEMTGDFMDDDDILLHPQRHQLPVDTERKSSNVTGANDDAARSFLPVDLSMDIMSNDDALSAPDFDEVSDDAGFHSKDRDPIVRTSSRPSASSPRSLKSFALPHQIVQSVSDAASDGMSCCIGCRRRRRLLIAAGVLVGLLLLAAVGIAIYLIV